MALETCAPSTAGPGKPRTSLHSPPPTSDSTSQPPKLGSNPEDTTTSKPSSVRSSSSSRGPAGNSSRKSKPSSLAPSTASIAKPCPSPSYEQVADSPPMTSFLNDRYAASTAQESVYLEHIRRLRIAKYVLSALVIAVAAGALACAGHALYSYNHTHLGSGWTLSLWPVNLDLKPTLAILVPAAIVIVSTVLYLAVAAVPSPHSRTILLNTLYLLATTTTLTLALFAVIFSSVLVHQTNPAHSPYARQSLQSFTCAFSRGPGKFAAAAAKLQLPVFGKIASPPGFARVCRESEAGMGLMAVIAGLSVVGVGLWAVGKRWERAIERGRRVRYDDKWGGSAREGSEEGGREA